VGGEADRWGVGGELPSSSLILMPPKGLGDRETSITSHTGKA